MHKGQIKLIHSAEHTGFPPDKIAFMKRTDLSIEELQVAYTVFAVYKETADIDTVEYILALIRENLFSMYEMQYIIAGSQTSVNNIISILESKKIKKEDKIDCINMLKDGWTVKDFIVIYQRCNELVKNGSLTEGTCKDWLRIVKYYIPNERIDINLRMEYADVVVCAGVNWQWLDIRYGLMHHIPAEEYKRCEFNKWKYIKTHVSHLSDLSSEFVNTTAESYKETVIPDMAELNKLE